MARNKTPPPTRAVSLETFMHQQEPRKIHVRMAPTQEKRLVSRGEPAEGMPSGVPDRIGLGFDNAPA